RLASMDCFTCRDRSTKVTDAAPRDRASSPNAPLPAKRSRQRAPAITGISQLNRVSRTRSGVGRNPSISGNCRRLPRHSPPMMRKEELLDAVFLDGRDDIGRWLMEWLDETVS